MRDRLASNVAHRNEQDCRLCGTGELILTGHNRAEAIIEFFCAICMSSQTRLGRVKINFPNSHLCDSGKLILTRRNRKCKFDDFNFSMLAS
jgi:hypothetical protein